MLAYSPVFSLYLIIYCNNCVKVNTSKQPAGDTPLHLAARKKDTTLCKVVYEPKLWKDVREKYNWDKE